MTRSRILTVAAIAVLTTGVVLVWAGEETPSFATSVTAPIPEAAPETTPLMDPEVLELYMEEPELIDDATVATTTTTESTTTTTIVATTTTEGAPATTSKSSAPTSPPTTQATTTTTAASSGGFDSAAESQFASSINSLRSSSGLSALSRNASLDSYARSWAEHMAQDGVISHSDIGSLLGEWSAVGENVGVGGSADSLFDAFVDSAAHRDNMLGDFTHFGIGVYRDSDGTMWTAQVFGR